MVRIIIICLSLLNFTLPRFHNTYQNVGSKRRTRRVPSGYLSNRQDQARPLLYYHRSHRALRYMHAYYKDVDGYSLCKDTSSTALTYNSASLPVLIGPHPPKRSWKPQKNKEKGLWGSKYHF